MLVRGELHSAHHRPPSAAKMPVAGPLYHCPLRRVTLQNERPPHRPVAWHIPAPLIRLYRDQAPACNLRGWGRSFPLKASGLAKLVFPTYAIRQPNAVKHL